MAIDVKKAINIAQDQASLFFEDEKIKNLMLEEVEYDDEDKCWLITLGYDSPNPIRKKTGSISAIFQDQTIEEEIKRQYKIFEINGKTGKFISMKIRNV